MQEQTESESEQRLAVLKELGLMDSQHEQTFQTIVELAAEICNTPIALITLLDDKRQWFKAQIGITATETPLSQAFCRHAIKTNQKLYEVKDPVINPKFKNNPLVTGDMRIRYYAGVPIKVKNIKLGTVCVIHQQEHELNETQKKQLKKLGELANKLLQFHSLKTQIKKLNLLPAEVMNTLSHDLNTPLTPILLDLYACQQKDPNNPALMRIEKSITRLQDTIVQAQKICREQL